jgi:hypothetical protein
MNWRRGVVKTAALDEPTVHWREPPVYPVVVFEQDRDTPRRSLKHRMNRQVGSGSSDGRVEATREVLALGSSAPDDPMVCQSIASEQLVNGHVRWRQRLVAPDEPTPRKTIASDHPTVLLSAAFSQQLVSWLGLFIPPPLSHLRFLDCVDVQESARHLENHIQSIQVLICSSLDLHMLRVCASC